jgi:hypothetical protein
MICGILSVAAGAANADSITFYENDNFRGRQFDVIPEFRSVTV